MFDKELKTYWTLVVISLLGVFKRAGLLRLYENSALFQKISCFYSNFIGLKCTGLSLKSRFATGVCSTCKIIYNFRLKT